MARILHLDDLSYTRFRIRELLGNDHEVISCKSIEQALSVTGEIDLYICGPMGKHSDGLLFALDRIAEGKKALILGDRMKFSKVPFLSIMHLASSGEMVRGMVGNMVRAEG